MVAKLLLPPSAPNKYGFLCLTYIAHVISIIYTAGAREEQRLCGITDLDWPVSTRQPISNDGLPCTIKVVVTKNGTRLFRWRSNLYSIVHVHRRWRTEGQTDGVTRWHWQVYAGAGTAIIAREAGTWYLEQWLI